LKTFDAVCRSSGRSNNNFGNPAMPAKSWSSTAELIDNRSDVAKATIGMMRSVFRRVPPQKIVSFYVDSDATPKQMAAGM
jgi:hypothetical protein